LAAAPYNRRSVKISLQATIVAALIFAAACLGVAIEGFASIADIVDQTQAADARGYAWFWMFLFFVCGLIATVAYWLLRKE